MTTPYPHYPHPSFRPAQGARRLNPWAVRLPVLLLTGLILLALVLALMVAGYELLHRNEIYPGVSTVLGVNIAGMSRQEAVAALEKQSTYADEAVFTFQFGDQQWDFTARELGVTFDAEATVDTAIRAGRRGSRLENLLKQAEMRTDGYPVAPVITYNQSEAELRLAEIAAAYVNRPVLDSTLVMRELQAIASPSQIGRSVDIAATLSVLRQEILALNTRSTIHLVVNETAPLVWETDRAAAQINLALSAPVEFYVDPLEGVNAGPWVSQVDSLQELLSINPMTYEDGTSGYDVALNLDSVREFLATVAPELTVEPVNARFVFNDDNRQLEVISPSVQGRRLDIEGTIAQVESAIFAADPAQRRVQLVFQNMPPAIRDSATALELGITEMVIQRTTYFYGSTAARRRNIDVAAGNFHGIVIPPGGIFSFNEWLGDVSVESGYEQGLIIVGNQTITGVGGGVCQVATTAFQTAFYGGFPILERVEHAYRVGYYEEGEGPGMDATVFSPIVDLRFKNDTPYHLLIETYVNQGNSTTTWKFYSTSMNRRVVKEGPVVSGQKPAPPPIYRANAALSAGQIRQVDYAVSGADVSVYRTVYEGDRVIIDREEFRSRYVPWADQYEVAPGDSRINS